MSELIGMPKSVSLPGYQFAVISGAGGPGISAVREIALPMGLQGEGGGLPPDGVSA